MKKNQIAGIGMAVCLICGMLLHPTGGLTVQAAEVIATVKGTILSGTTSELLRISTKDGTMEVKLDSATDASACKILLPGKEISVSLSHESDGYLHAVKITSDVQAPAVTVDASTAATVTGTVSTKTTEEILYFDTAQGEMQIKLDTTTNMSGCSVLVVDKTYSIVCARGSDAYMHAVSISDASAAGNNMSGTGAAGGNTVPAGTAAAALSPAPSPAVPGAAASVSGTVTENTKENLLYLSTKDGEMQFVIDSGADTRSGVVLTPGNKLTVAFYHGSDAYLHAVSTAGVKDAASGAEIDTANTAVVSGTVGSKSTESILFLDTPQGEMELKLDAVGSISGCKVFVSGKKLTVTCARGSDAYMHALNITAN